MIEEALYREIVANMPIPCVDIVVSSPGKYIMALRRNEPARDQWWFPGGRILKGETFHAAAIRLARQELGIEVEVSGVYGAYELFFKATTFEGVPAHAIAVAVLVNPVGCIVGSDEFVKMVKLDSQHSMWAVFNMLPKEPYLRQVIQACGIL